ncbi:hypothetical protein [Streptomyces shaanxiensis]|uniref:Uncharacterized protein n=1 Tax=Streptomyces shaanxiensis TaxID=653357 RepID=A0ABP7VVJ9_9ACTN
MTPEPDNDSKLNKFQIWVGIAAAALAILGFFGITKFTDVWDFLFPGPARTPKETDTGGPSGPQSDPPGGPPATESSSSQPISLKAKYVQEADRVCEKWYKESGKLDNSTPNLKFFNDLISITTSLANEWAALTPPPGDEDEINELIEKPNRDVEAFRAARDRWLEGDPEWSDELDKREAEESSSQRRASARKYGFRVCW